MTKSKIRDTIFDKLGKPTTLDELAHTIIGTVNTFSDAKIDGFVWRIKRKKIQASHNAPVGKVPNFTVPEFFFGWSGRLWVRYKTMPKSFGSDPFRNTLTYTGTGGAGTYDGPFTDSKNSFSWEYRFYEDDWPTLKKNLSQERLLKTLSHDEKGGRTFLNPYHNFEWYGSD